MEGSQCLRKKAFQKIALRAAVSTQEAPRSDFSRLQDVFSSSQRTKSNPSSLSASPMTTSELEALLSLCEAAPFLQNEETAQQLLRQLSPYMLEAHNQALVPSPFLHTLQPSPWELLAYKLTYAVLSIGLRYPQLHSTVVSITTNYLQNCLHFVNSISKKRRLADGTSDAVEEEVSLDTATVTVSLLGFLQALSVCAHFCSASEMLDLVGILHQILDENLMVSVEGVFSSIRTSESNSRALLDWKLYSNYYATSRRPLSAMLLQHDFMRLLVSCSSLHVTSPQRLQEANIFSILISDEEPSIADVGDTENTLLDLLADIVAESMRLLEDGSDFLQLGSVWQQQLAYAVKAYSLLTFLNVMVVNENVADIDTFMSWLEDAMADSTEMSNETLSYVVLKSTAVIAKFSPSVASTLSRSLPRFVVQGGIKGELVDVAAQSLTYILQLLSQDAVITGLYSLGNVLSARSSTDRSVGSSDLPNGNASSSKSTGQYTQQSTGSAISLDLSNEEETATAYGNVVRAIVGITERCQDERITALAQSMLLQKLGRISLAVDLHIVTEAAKLARAGGPAEFKSLLKLYARLNHEAILKGNSKLADSIEKAGVYIAHSLEPDSSLFPVYLAYLLESIVSKGDVHESDNTHQVDVDLAAREIVALLPALAALVSKKNQGSARSDSDDIGRLCREAWFNIVVHGITPISPLGQQYADKLGVFALHSGALIAEDRVDQFDSEIELNTVLRRGMNAPHTAEQKKRLISLLPRCESDIRGLTYPKVIFLNATYLVETARARSGDCSRILIYFMDPELGGSSTGNCLRAIADEVMSVYLRASLSAPYRNGLAPKIAEQLAVMFIGCCHRMPGVQQIAAACVVRIIDHMPASLCQKSSLFALLELLSILWSSCLEADLDEYAVNANHVSARGHVSLELSDDYESRRSTLNNFYKRARAWVISVIRIAPLDVKGLLQTYLSEYDDEGGYGHVALGRSFALDMGSIISPSDQKLGAINRQGECNINTGSDFIAQYTTRQEYRCIGALIDGGWERSTHSGDDSTASPLQQDDNDQRLLSQLERLMQDRKSVSVAEMRDVLRRATAHLCRNEDNQCTIIQYLINIPFVIFTKQSIKLGVSLWLGAINENPRMESRILSAVVEQWERTVHERMGVFSQRLKHLDPFYIKEEFAPSEKAALTLKQQVAHDLIAPHLRLLQFLNGHFNANRQGSPHLHRIFLSMITTTLQGLRHSAAHPLAREFYLQAVLFGINLLRHCIGFDQATRWKLKDTILSAALSWFSHPPRWSFGGNRLQIKAEVRLLSDVEDGLSTISRLFEKPAGSSSSLALKQDLLQALLQHEHTRLEVWLYPLDHGKRHVFSTGNSSKALPEGSLSSFLHIAWIESPSLVVQLNSRFNSAKLNDDIRRILLRSPERAIEEPEALQVLIGSSMPPDISAQSRYLLYWAAVNPVTAVTYFLPDFRNDPFLIQYAVRTLESHTVDVTFFYVPQIVQTLRYDVLGYVQRYIVETAKFSQLFAHQIIWNMTANAYKDEDSSVEDSLKPTLDIVKERMIASFSGTDKAFYEREFSFFGEVTGISGKLRPYIKRSKPEKKQKIEEELRQIKVEVGVYLPSNPEGTVIGIDRKSGKPLQSHAKAPYMATFRIKKNRGEMGGTEDMLEKTNQNQEDGRNGPVTQESTYEVWQSAIFKVGDDCRQDVLALQMIAAFRGIYNDVGLDVYVYPYRVTATAPGCGVIDVLPNSISRDMLGREAVNGLYDYFVSKYGTENSIRFQEARNNFVKSMAAYSVISYLLQFKDRHNGNIMVDDAGHILHIDFGFCFDIAPGGVRFERAPFKLTSEMVAVMGGLEAQSYRWFEELCIKAFLACRQHAERLCHIVILMLGSGLPCFKPETIAHLKQRFVLEKGEREAADFMRDLIKKSQSSYSTKGYDQFQLLTNGIPY